MTALTDRLHALAALRPGWLDGTGAAVDRVCLGTVNMWLSDVSPTPTVYPTPSGGVSCEWLIGRMDVSLDVEPHQLSMHAIDLDSGLVAEVNRGWVETGPNPIAAAIDYVTGRATP